MFKTGFLPRITVFYISFIVLRERTRTHPGSLFLDLEFQERILGIIWFSVVNCEIYKKFGRALAAIAHCRNTPESEFPGGFCFTIVWAIHSHNRALYSAHDDNTVGVAALPRSGW